MSMEERNDPYFTQDLLPGPDPHNQNPSARAATIEDDVVEECKGLQPGWVAHWSQTHNRIYYQYKRLAKSSMWEKPGI